MSNPNLIRSSKTIRKKNAAGDILETSIVTRRIPSSSSSGIAPPSRIPPSTSRIPPPTSRIPPPTSRIPPPSSRIPPPSSRLPPSFGLPPPSSSRLPPPSSSRIPPPLSSRIPGSGLRPPSQTELASSTVIGKTPKTKTVTSRTTTINPDGTRSTSTKKSTYKTTKTLPTLTVTRPTGSMEPIYSQRPQTMGTIPATAGRSLETIPSTSSAESGGAIRKVTKKTTKSSGYGPQGKKIKTTTSTIKTTRVPKAPAPRSMSPELLSDIMMPPDLMSLSELELDVQDNLRTGLQTGGPTKAVGTKTQVMKTPIIQTPRGPVPIDKQVVMESKLDRSTQGEMINRHIMAIENQGGGTASMIELDKQEMEIPNIEQIAGSMGIPSHDIISIQSTVSKAGDTKQTTTKVIYETDKPGALGGEDGADGSKEPELSPEEISKLIDEENKDIEDIHKMASPEMPTSSVTYPLKKKLQDLLLTTDTVAILEKSIVLPPPTGDEEQEELQPELIAAIMHTEEIGLAMDSQPNRVYNYLFPDAKTEHFLDVGSAAPAIMQDVVIPVGVPDNMQADAMSDEMKEATISVQNVDILPPESTFNDSVLKKDVVKVKNVAKAKRKSKKPVIPISEEKPPFDMEDVQTIVELVGATPSPSVITDGSFIIPEPKEPTQGIDFMVHLQPPRHVSRVQLRGTQKPPWFPGYFLALPDIPDLVKVEKSPNNVLAHAWRAVQPKLFSDDSFLLI